MKCPKCGEELVVRMKVVGEEADGTQVYNTFAMCRNCKKKWNIDKKKDGEMTEIVANESISATGTITEAAKSEQPVVRMQVEEPVQEKKYSNIPPKEVREKREAEIKKNYGYMLQQARIAEEEEKQAKSHKVRNAFLMILIVAIASTGLFFFFNKINLVGKMRSMFNPKQESVGMLTEESSADMGSGNSDGGETTEGAEQ